MHELILALEAALRFAPTPKEAKKLPGLNGILFEFEAGNLYLYASNGCNLVKIAIGGIGCEDAKFCASLDCIQSLLTSQDIVNATDVSFMVFDGSLFLSAGSVVQDLVPSEWGLGERHKVFFQPDIKPANELRMDLGVICAVMKDCQSLIHERYFELRMLEKQILVTPELSKDIRQIEKIEIVISSTKKE